MVKYLCLAVSIILANFQANSQNRVADSLERIVLHAKDDSSKAIALNDLFWEFSYTDLSKAKGFAEQSLAFSKKIRFKKGEGSALNSLGVYYEETGNYKSALNCYFKAMAIFDSIHRSGSLAIVYSNIAIIYKVLGNYETAMDYNLKALKIKENSGNELDLADSYNNIGSLYGIMGKNDKSLLYHYKALAIRQQIKDKRGIAYSLNNIAEVYREKKEYAKAIRTYQQSRKVLDEVKDDIGVATVFANIGSIYKDQKKFPDAIRNMNIALNMVLKTGVRERITYMYEKLGESYFEMGDYVKSNKYYTLCYREAKSIGHKDMLMESYYFLSDLAAKREDFKDAYNYHRKYSELRDTLLNAGNSKQLTELEIRYETEKKDNEIKLLHQGFVSQKLMVEKRNQWIIFLSILFTLVLLILILVYRFIHFKNKQLLINTVLKTENAERLRIAKDMHDELGSSLSKIQLFSGIALQNIGDKKLLEDNMRRISTSVNELTVNIRDLIWAMNPENAILENLLAHIREYCSDFLEEFPLEYSLNFPEAVPHIRVSQKVQRNIFLVLKEALNNAVKHADATFINVSIHVTKDCNIHISISDNGKGFNPLEVKKKGNGMANMEDRIIKINGEYHLLSSPGNGTTIDFSVYSGEVSQITSK